MRFWQVLLSWSICFTAGEWFLLVCTSLPPACKYNRAGSCHSAQLLLWCSAWNNVCSDGWSLPPIRCSCWSSQPFMFISKHLLFFSGSNKYMIFILLWSYGVCNWRHMKIHIYLATQGLRLLPWVNLWHFKSQFTTEYINASPWSHETWLAD